MKTIKVTQSVRERIAPDGMTVRLHLRAENKKYDAAADALRDAVATAEKMLMRAGLQKDEIFSSGASITHERRDGKTLFCARTDMRITLSVTDARAGALLDAAEESGAEWSQEYVLLGDAHRKDLLKKAVQEARAAAETIAAAAGVRLGALVSVTYGGDGMGAPRMMRAMALAEPEQIETEETVTCEWEIAE